MSIVDYRDYWENQVFAPGVPRVPPITNSNPCSYGTLPNDREQAIRDAISKLLFQLGGGTQSYYDVYFQGACNSEVKLSFPNGAFFTGAPDDLGHIDTFYISAGSTVTQSIPCSDACCKATYEWKTITLTNGETRSLWVPISYQGDSVDCANQVTADYNIYSNKLQAKIYDPITGTYNTVTGTVIAQEPCELTCQRLLTPPPPVSPVIFLNTDVVSKAEPMVFSANPTLVNNFIHFESNTPITKVVVYDISGKRLMQVSRLENNELNTSELKSGMYFVQVYFKENNNVKTVKILKQ